MGWKLPFEAVSSSGLGQRQTEEQAEQGLSPGQGFQEV